jgi:hypothetical protein
MCPYLGKSPRPSPSVKGLGKAFSLHETPSQFQRSLQQAKSGTNQNSKNNDTMMMTTTTAK